MNNKANKYGNINDDGVPGNAARIFNPNVPDFYEYIEDGILPLIKCFNELGIFTYSSCEGHFYGDLDRKDDFALCSIYLPRNKVINPILLKSFISDGIVELRQFSLNREKQIQSNRFVGMEVDRYKLTFFINPRKRELLNDYIKTIASIFYANKEILIQAK